MTSAEARLSVSTFGKPLAVLVAAEIGLFEAAGLDVDYHQVGGSSEQIEQLLAGAFDIAHTAIDNVMASVDRGRLITAFMVLELGTNQKLLVRPEIHGYEDLVGAVLGVDALDTGYAYLLREMLEQNGLSDQTYRLVATGGSAQRAVALADGEIVGTLLAPPHDWPLSQAGCKTLDRAARYVPDYPALTAATTPQVASERRDALVRYVAAVASARRWAVDARHRSEAIDLIARARNRDATTAEEQYREEVGQTTVTTLADAFRGVQVVQRLRSKMTDGRGGREDVRSYFDSSLMLAAGFTQG